MPPYAYDEGIGIQHLIGDWRLKQEEIEQIVTWVEQGAPLGDPDSAPPPYQLKDPSEWNFAAELGQPDLIVPSSSYDIPASGNDLWSNEIVDPGITSDRCIKAVQVKPRGDAAAVVHHANSSVLILILSIRQQCVNLNPTSCMGMQAAEFCYLQHPMCCKLLDSAGWVLIL